IEQSLADGLSPRPHSFYIPLPSEIVERSAHATGPFTIGFPGAPRIESRAHLLLQAISELSTPAKLIWLLDEPELPQAKELCKEFGVSSVEFVLGRSPESWQQNLPRLNIAVHTLFSVFGSTAPYVQQSLLAKLPIVTVRFGASELLPPAATIHLEPGDAEATQLRSVLEQQIASPRLNAVGFEYACETFLTQQIATELAELLVSNASPMKAGLHKWTALEADARKNLLETVWANRQRKLQPAGVTVDPLERVFAELGWVE
ncbi:MAG: hypothetical protein EBZ48_14240, partial [Proteobacteria bacterium]|nr:hypothetical protein [Pseudomonadota bacterium]